jgi:hypothetical protein
LQRVPSLRAETIAVEAGIQDGVAAPGVYTRAREDQQRADPRRRPGCGLTPNVILFIIRADARMSSTLP